MTEILQETCSVRIIHSDRVEAAQQNTLSDADHDKLVNLFKAMGDPTRLKVLFALAAGEMCVCDLAAFLEITESAVSHQLRMLRQLYLVANRREGQILYYRLNDQHIEQLINIGLDHIRD